MPRTRLAPSPTGALHLGNARTFFITWALARQSGAEVILRIEDLDGPRVKPEAAQQAIEDLRWLGIDWDSGPMAQRTDLSPYQTALKTLARAGGAFPCDCTRQQIQAATLSAPHGDEHEVRYPGTCRPDPAGSPHPSADAEPDFARAWRLLVPNVPIAFADEFHGPQAFDLQATTGDFLIWTKQGLPSYQLAVVVDDARQGVDWVIRGDDLLSSAARQILLYERLALGPPPRYTHLPLVVGPDGRRLAKRHGDTRIATFRAHGVPRDRLLALLARWSGLPSSERVSPDEFLAEFRLDRLPRDKITFSADDAAWLAG
jgi:glutamyl-tRNA synthetase